MKMKKQPLTQNEIDRRISDAFHAAVGSKGVRINLMSVDKLYERGRIAIQEGTSQEGLEMILAAFAETILERK